MRFTIRELLWPTMVVALGVGWLVDHRDKAAHREKARIYRDALQNHLDWYHHESGKPISVQLESDEILEPTIDCAFMSGSS